MLPSLLRKAVGDAGFDLTLGPHAEWERIGVSGVPSQAWVLPVQAGALVAVIEHELLQEFRPTTWTEVPLPPGVAGAIRCHTAAELYDVLRRARVLLAQLPPAPEQRFAARLAAIGSTETEAIVMQRVGQALFREMLFDYWDGKCAVTGLDVPELLRASHVKPWKDATDPERLDVYNGFLLAVHLDALFDQGFLTFSEDGTGVLSQALPLGTRDLIIGTTADLRLRRVAGGHRPYLEYHKHHVFRTSSGR